MKKRSLTLLLALAMGLSIPLNGCKSETGQTESKQTESKQTESKQTETTKKQETFKFSAMLNGRGVDDTNTAANKAWLKKMEELMGMKVEIEWKYVPNAEYDDKMKILLSSNDLPDYFLLPFLYDYTQMAKEGYFLDLAKYDMSNYLKYVDQAKDGRMTAFMDDGTMPVLYQIILPTVEKDKTPIFQTQSMYNYTAFQKEGIKVPETLDDVYNAAKQFKAKYPKSFPVNVNYAGIFSVFYAHHVYANLDGAGSLYWDGKQYTFAGLQPQYKEGVEYLRKLYAEGLFDPEYIVDTPDTIKKKMLNENNFMLLNSWRTHPTEYTRDSGNKTTFVSAFVPDNPKYGKAWQTFSRANQVELMGWTIHAVNSEVKNPELMAKFLNFQFTPEVYEITSWGVKDTTYTIGADGKKKFIDEFHKAEDPSKVADKYGLWNDRSGRANPGLRTMQDNMAREISFPLNDYTYFGGKYEEAPIQQSTFFKNLKWPNDYIPPTYDGPTLRLTKDENAEASSILTQLVTYTSQMQAKFISGEESMDKWDSFMNTFKNSYQIQRVLDIYNAAAKRYSENKK